MSHDNQIAGKFQRVGRLKKSSIDASPTSDRCATDLYTIDCRLISPSFKEWDCHARADQTSSYFEWWMSVEDPPICDSDINLLRYKKKEKKKKKNLIVY